MSKEYQLLIIGFGTVGEGVYRTIQSKREKLSAILGREVKVPAILVKERGKSRDLEDHTRVATSLEEISAGSVDLVVEATPDAETGYPYVTHFLKKGIPVVTANKELIAKKGEELFKLAEVNDSDLLFEAAVAGGIPLLNTLRHTLKTNNIEQINGILNGTSNYVLTKMQNEGTSFDAALQEAQEKGYAEAVPDKDVDGWDAYYKASILSHWIYGAAPEWEEGAPAGIRSVTVEDLLLAEKATGKIKHVASLKRSGFGIQASVRPCFIFSDHHLYSVNGVDNGVHIKGSLSGDLLLQGPGAGQYPTASAVIEDVVNVLQGKNERGIQDRIIGSLDDESEPAGEFSFITGSEGILRHLRVRGIPVIAILHHPSGKHIGAAVKTDDQSLSDLHDSVSESFSVYPVLGNESEIRKKFQHDGKQNAVSF
ncbi:homoserine dehydrogenase [Bacillus sp. H-16]|uniref:homoserine dehydrogenase n=1 Tax=Alteribacter salitolerans TaxID=2912333 RepID=UPI00196646C0|nr:homoserine dehydrogenase [Alteribacter salitolerans]